MRASDLAFLTIAEASRLIAARELSPVEYTEALLKRIADLDPQLDAFITLAGDLARDEARRAEAEIAAGRYKGPLHGIPFALKDIYNTRGIATTGGSKVARDNIPDADATTTRLLREAGGILVGKLQLHEFAHGGPSFDLPWPPSRNPWNTAHATGGSSSGSGAALAAGLVPATLGSDTGGSIRNPASLCGIVGLKPTAGLVSRAGVIPNSFTLDHCGPMTRTVEDCAILLQAIAGYDAADPGSADVAIPDYRAALRQDIRGVRIGVLRHYWEEDLPVSPAVAAAMEAALDVFRGLGARVEDCRARPLEDAFATKLVIGESEIYSVHHAELTRRPGDFGRDFLGRALPACLFGASDYVQALREQRQLIAEMKPLYEKYDVMVSVGLGPAPLLEANKTINFWRKRADIFRPANLTGAPSLVLPNGFSGGLPLGMQVNGRPFDEVTVLRVAHAYEQAAGWYRRHPSLERGAPKPVVAVQENAPHRPDIADATRSQVLLAARAAGFELDERLIEILMEGAPYALALGAELRASRPRTDMPSVGLKLPR